MHKAFTKMFVARMRKGLTQQEIADKIGVTQPRISAWESGKVAIPPERAAQLAKILNVEADKLDQPAL